jgi:hypothetical protein
MAEYQNRDHVLVDAHLDHLDHLDDLQYVAVVMKIF